PLSLCHFPLFLFSCLAWKYLLIPSLVFCLEFTSFLQYSFKLKHIVHSASAVMAEHKVISNTKVQNGLQAFSASCVLRTGNPGGTFSQPSNDTSPIKDHDPSIH